MSGLSDEEVESIRERVARNEDARGEFLKAQPIERDIVTLLAHVDHLTAENARLREGIESVRVNALCAEEFLPRGGLALRETARKCAALLNPPTEGETDERR